MKTTSAILSAALLAGSSVAHVAIKPPSPDRWLTPNSSTAPSGCKLLASDKGFPTEEEVLKIFPNAFRKLKGTEGPDFWIQPQTVEEVQKAVNFAREKNIRLNVITTGHDFHGREDSRSGLRVDMAAFVEPTVFSNDWKCGDSLKPKSNGKIVERTIACKIPSQRENVGRGIPGRNYDWIHFEKRDGESTDCSALLKRHLRKRHGPDAEEEMGGHGHGGPGAKIAETPKDTPVAVQADVKFDTAKPWEWAQKTGFKLPDAAKVVNSFNKIKLTGKHAYARVSGGMYNEKFFMQAHESGLMSLGAQHGGVSTLGGWMQAGGHNPFANIHGMMVDNVVELEVVTPDGKFQKASECENKDLFWALRGGGGGTYGIVTGGTVKVHPTFPVTVSRFFVNVTEPYDPKLFKAVAHFLQRGTKLRDEYGFQGYFYVYPNGFHSVLHHPDKYATLENAKKGVAEIQGEMEKIAGAKHIEPTFFEHKTYKEWYVAEMGDEEMEESGTKARSWYDGSWGDAPSSEDVMMNPMLMVPFKLADAQREAKEAAAKEGKSAKPALLKRQESAAAAATVLRSQPMGRTYLDSRLFSDKQVNSVSLDKLAEAVDKTFPRLVGNHVRGFLYGGGEQAKPAKDAMGLLPDWRDMTYHYIINALPGNTRHDFNIRAFDQIIPEAGGYVNEAAPGEPDWKKKYWGVHYEKLEAFKKKIDPENVLWCSPCVGADLLTYDDERICKNPNYPQAGPSPQTYPDAKSKTGIASLPGRDGIPNPLNPIIQGWMQNKTIPSKMPASGFFKMAMGQGGSSGGRWALGPPPNSAAPAMEGHGHGEMTESTSSIPKDSPKDDAPPKEAAPKNAEAPKGSVPKVETSTPAAAEPTVASEATASAPSVAATPSSAGPVVEAAPKTSKGKGTGTGSLSGLSGKGKSGSSSAKNGKTSGKLSGLMGKGKASSKTGKASRGGLSGLLGLSRVEIEEIERTVVPSGLL